MEILTFSRKQVDKMYTALGKCNRIQCQRGMLRNNRFNEVINENKLSALNNYAEHNNATIYINDLENDMFNDVGVYVYKSGVDGNKGFLSNLKSAKEDLGGCLRGIYKQVENAINELKG